jgi:gamma-glutamyltranspeptidase
LNASGRSPYALNRECLPRTRLEEHPHPRAALLVGAGLRERLADAAGPLRHAPLAELLEPAARTAEEGFPVTE